jgi:hypothetical protein
MDRSEKLCGSCWAGKLQELHEVLLVCVYYTIDIEWQIDNTEVHSGYNYAAMVLHHATPQHPATPHTLLTMHQTLAARNE